MNQPLPHQDAASRPTIVASGSVHYDLVLRVPRLPGDNDRISPAAVMLAPGGMGGNVAAAAARLGGDVRFVGQFASDDDGDALRDDLIREGVDVRWASRRESPTRYRGSILVDNWGQRAILGAWPDTTLLERSPGQGSGLIRDLTIRGSHREIAARHGFGSTRFSPEAFAGDNVAVAAPFNFAPLILPFVPNSIPVYLDIETGHVNGWSEAEIWSTLRRTTVLYGNQRNLEDLARQLDQPSVNALSRTLRGTIVETAGELGCELHESGKRTIVPGIAVETVDTTGAGDCFAAACTLALRRGCPLLEAARFANIAAALSTRALGSRQGVPRHEEVETYAAKSADVPRTAPGFLKWLVRHEIHGAHLDNRESIPPELFAMNGANMKGRS